MWRCVCGVTVNSRLPSPPPFPYTLFTQLEAGGGGGGGGLLFIKINLQTRLLIVTSLVNEA